MNTNELVAAYSALKSMIGRRVSVTTRADNTVTGTLDAVDFRPMIVDCHSGKKAHAMSIPCEVTIDGTAHPIHKIKSIGLW